MNKNFDINLKIILLKKIFNYLLKVMNINNFDLRGQKS